MSFITLRDIYKSYGKPPNVFEALRGVNLEISQGEFVLVVVENPLWQIFWVVLIVQVVESMIFVELMYVD